MNVTERFLKYVSFGTNSDEYCEKCPSSKEQLTIGKYIADELIEIGIEDVIQDDNGYVYGYLKGNGELSDAEAIGFIAHMDTSPSVKGDGIRPEIVKYTGNPIILKNGSSVLSAEEFKFLNCLNGEELIVTDGDTLLGADDKAGIAEIVTMCEKLVGSDFAHRPIAVAFTPDEEIGRGADLFNLSLFRAKEAYTVDGGPIGEIEFENFNAAGLKLSVNGVNIHPGEAKNKMKNAVLMANSFISMLPEAETPAHTEGYEGFYHITDISGDETLCTVRAIIRDHDRDKFEKRKQFVINICEYLNGVWGENSFVPEITDSYYNMKEMILPHMYLIDNAERAFADAGITPRCVPIRGGTDGARLSYMGLPCPNLSTGGYNFHSCRELIPASSLEKMVDVLENLAR